MTDIVDMINAKRGIQKSVRKSRVAKDGRINEAVGALICYAYEELTGKNYWSLEGEEQGRLYLKFRNDLYDLGHRYAYCNDYDECTLEEIREEAVEILRGRI